MHTHNYPCKMIIKPRKHNPKALTGSWIVFYVMLKHDDGSSSHLYCYHSTAATPTNQSLMENVAVKSLTNVLVLPWLYYIVLAM